MMSKIPDEIKKAMRGCHAFDSCSQCPYFDLSATISCKMRRNADALVLIQQLEAENAQQARCIENLTDKLNATNEALPRWIGVEERLPEDGEDVLVHVKYSDDVSDTKVAHRVMKKWYLRVAHRVGGVVTHWMPLPEPPKEE